MLPTNFFPGITPLLEDEELLLEELLLELEEDEELPLSHTAAATFGPLISMWSMFPKPVFSFASRRKALKPASRFTVSDEVLHDTQLSVLTKFAVRKLLPFELSTPARSGESPLA